MSIQTRLEGLRAKPERVRTRIAFWSSFGITAVIFMFWLASFTSIGTPASGAIASAVDKAGAPAQSLLASVGDFFLDIKDLFLGPKKIEYAEVEVTAGER